MKLISLLHQSLETLDLPNKNTREGTTILISKTIHDLCVNHKIEFQAEVILWDFIIERTGSHGVLDFLIIYNGEKYAIEIDSANKKRSLQKLELLADIGYKSIWIRWGYPIELEIPNNIYLMDFTNKNISPRVRKRAPKN